MSTLAADASSGASSTAADAADGTDRRRDLRFESLADILRDVEALDAADSVRTLGTWTPAQNIDHVRRLIRLSHAGGDVRLPLPFRIMGRLLRGLVLRMPMKGGIKSVPFFEPPADLTWDDAVAAFRDDVAKASRAGAMSHPSPLLGKISHGQWERLHCRHAELHFGFLHADNAT